MRRGQTVLATTNEFLMSIKAVFPRSWIDVRRSFGPENYDSRSIVIDGAILDGRAMNSIAAELISIGPEARLNGLGC
ncbi:hypothetical protein GWI33_019185 [Rhynchophorus ferrugineus]|uniref:Uncharacterized protein n=1 Tax=Rhynchophorus ferrugineus TaxID=354439 RepID=A0A834HWJ5_RHYFE|nr:hypothetical protein GWI33_019185 [Rhynchophorus ferrugineus]